MKWEKSPPKVCNLKWIEPDGRVQQNGDRLKVLKGYRAKGFDFEETAKGGMNNQWLWVKEIMKTSLKS